LFNITEGGVCVCVYIYIYIFTTGILIINVLILNKRNDIYEI